MKREKGAVIVKRLYDKWGAGLAFAALLPAFAAMLVRGVWVWGPAAGAALVAFVQKLFNTGTPDPGPTEGEKELERSRVSWLNSPAVVTSLYSNRGGGIGMAPTSDIRATSTQKSAVYSWLAVFASYLVTIIGISDRLYPGPVSFGRFKLMLAWGGALMAADILRRRFAGKK